MRPPTGAFVRLHGDGNQGHVEGGGRGLGKQRERGVGRVGVGGG